MLTKVSGVEMMNLVLNVGNIPMNDQQINRPNVNPRMNTNFTEVQQPVEKANNNLESKSKSSRSSLNLFT